MPRKSIQDIIIKRENVRRSPSLYAQRAKGDEPSQSPQRGTRNKNEAQSHLNKWYKNKWLLLLVVVVFIILGFGLLTLKSSAEVSITPKSQIISVDFVARANKDLAGKGDDISFSIFTAEESRSTVLSSDGVKKVDIRAQGKIIVFNKYRSKPLKLSPRTRFETPDGKIFMIGDSIVVPGVVTKSGEKNLGSIEVMVSAGEPGKEYNIGLTDFTIPGLKGTPLYDGFFARSKTEMKGGFSGPVKIVDENEQISKRNKLETDIAGVLTKKVEEAISGGLISFNDGIFTTFTEELNIQTDNKDDSVPYIVSGTIRAIVFDRKELANIIARNGGVLDTQGLTLANIKDLEIIIEDKDLVKPDKDTTLNISISGQARIVWPVNEVNIKNALSGKDKNERTYQSIFASQFPNIVEARVTSFNPFWAKKFPNDVEKIKIINTISN